METEKGKETSKETRKETGRETGRETGKIEETRTQRERESKQLHDEQARQREEVGEEIIERIRQIISEMFPEMEGVEPLIQDEEVERVADNILHRLREFGTGSTSHSMMERAWKSLLFRREITDGEATLIRRVIAVINRKGEVLRIDRNL